MASSILSQVKGMAQMFLRVLPSRDLPSESSQTHQIQEDLQALQRMVERIQAVLNDAERRVIVDDESVRLWLRELKGIAYDADDVLDGYEYEVLRTESEAADIQAGNEAKHLPRRRGRQQVSEVALKISFDESFLDKIASRIVKIRNRFEEISSQRAALQLSEGGGDDRFPNIVNFLPSSPFIGEPDIYGRMDDLKQVINRLQSDECRARDLSVLPIVGMGGVGKTTFVQHVFKAIGDDFQLKGWVCVSDDFRVEKLTIKIIESLTREQCRLNEFGPLQETLANIVAGKRFLLVLDDVWNESYHLWDALQIPLRRGMPGSTVITTTRTESVAKIMQTMSFHPLKCLSDDDCWEIFQQRAFSDRNPNDHRNLVEIGRQIVKRCGGLPLAAKSLGGLLRFEDDEAMWNEVLHSNIWDLSNDIIIPALRLSYLHLPSYVRPCFIYTSIFPRDFGFRRKWLILLWMAHGFLQHESEGKAEFVGNRYFNELLSRSFFQHHPAQVDEDDPCFVMHNLFHDLAQYISGQEILHVEDGKAYAPLSKEVRHLSAFNQCIDDSPLMHSLSDQTPLAIRSLLLTGSAWEELTLPSEMMPHLEFLRALDLGHSCLYELPHSICNWKHLRYLNLDGTNIERLPESVCKLYYLQTLYLRYCSSLKSLPKNVKDLSKLRCLRMEGTHFYFLPKGIGRLTSIRTLDTFMVGVGCSIPFQDCIGQEEEFNDLLLQISSQEYCGIKELGGLEHLSGRLIISNLRCATEAEDARVADLSNKRDITELHLHWTEESAKNQHELPSRVASSSEQEQVLENLRPPDRLQVLGLQGYDGLKFPSWMVDDLSSFCSLVRVKIEGFRRCRSLPPFGVLPSLKHLEITRVDMVTAVVGLDFSGGGNVGFPALEVLMFSGMSRWVTWGAREGDFPRLRYLGLHDCHKLESMIPLYLLPQLQVLGIEDCPMLKFITLKGHTSSSSASSSSIGPALLTRMIIRCCPRARFSPEDDEDLVLPPALKDLVIDRCPYLAKWCRGGRGSRLNHIPNATVLSLGVRGPENIFDAGARRIGWPPTD